MKRRFLLALLLAAAGCAAPPPPPRAPSITTPADALPGDLDLVVRVDLEKVRAALGPAGAELMRRGTGALPSDPGTELVARALERTSVAFLALRPELVPGEADNVLVLSGRFADLGLDQALASAGFASPVDLGADVRRFDRKTKVGRAAPARIYVFRNEQLVFVSAAELDSVEAVLERGMRPSPLRPREQGVLAFAARLRALRYGIAQRYPSIARAVGDAAGVEGSIDATPEGLGLDLSLELPSELDAQASAEALGRVKEALEGADGKLGALAKGARAEAVGRYVVVRLALVRGLLE
ncbi:MAG TPA: hypothetical protein VNN72_25750 [Polyangiaceae bacterium]|nr:hypothetical protein [Polyangiaceae bacterium]